MPIQSLNGLVKPAKIKKFPILTAEIFSICTYLIFSRERTNSTHLMRMKLNNPKKFEELNVAPALDS